MRITKKEKLKCNSARRRKIIHKIKYKKKGCGSSIKYLCGIFIHVLKARMVVDMKRRDIQSEFCVASILDLKADVDLFD